MAAFHSFCVRGATLQDIDVIVEFNSAMALESEGKSLDQRRLRDGVTPLFDKDYGDDRGFYLVAEAEGRVVGQLMITYEWSDWRNAYFWWIQSVYVASDWRRRGVSTQGSMNMSWTRPGFVETSVGSGSTSTGKIVWPSRCIPDWAWTAPITICSRSTSFFSLAPIMSCLYIDSQGRR